MLPIAVSSKTVKLEGEGGLRINPQRHLICKTLSQIVEYYDKEIKSSKDLAQKDAFFKSKIDAINNILFEKTHDGKVVGAIKVEGDILRGVVGNLLSQACDSAYAKDVGKLSEYYSNVLGKSGAFAFLKDSLKDGKSEKQELKDVNKALKNLSELKLVSKDDALSKVVENVKTSFSSKFGQANGAENIVSADAHFVDRYSHCARIVSQVKAGKFSSSDDNQTSWVEKIQKSSSESSREL